MTGSHYITEKIKNLGLCSAVHNIKPLSGGSISQAAKYATDKGDFFVKVRVKNKLNACTRTHTLIHLYRQIEIQKHTNGSRQNH